MLRIGAMAAYLAGSLVAGVAPAAAQPATSIYTDLDLTRCTIMKTDDFGSTWACPGLKGIPVMVAEGDLRMFVSFGLSSTTEKAATQTLPPFNRLGDTIEWRVDGASGRWLPYATILRYFTQRDTGEPEGQVLVVTKFAAGATCQVALVDALANPDANELARAAADLKARDFDCADEPETIGEFAAW
jgi:hypothetical protein